MYDIKNDNGCLIVTINIKITQCYFFFEILKSGLIDIQINFNPINFMIFTNTDKF